ncbi:MAG: NUDIX domain-containing protein [Oscillospiraceae bacterium]|nr:NUDIX domain-containing protein [Oscillospiraceae bacterium]
MARKPENIHVYLYRKNAGNEIEYAIFQRSDDPNCWQGVSGGVEDGETIEQAALRESFEEAGTSLSAPIYGLDTVSYLPADIFSEHTAWGKDIVVCPMYFFAMSFDGNIILSYEHTEVRWLTYQEAYNLVYWHDQKTALWELNQRLERGNLIRTA